MTDHEHPQIAPEPLPPDERPHRRREYSGAGSTLGLAAVVVLAVGLAIWWFEIRGSDTGEKLDGGGYGIVALADDLNPTGRAPAADDGRAAPNWNLVTDAGPGSTSSLTDYRGEWVVMNFWASWCQPCNTEAPDLQELQESGAVVVVGVNQQEELDDVADFRKRLAVTYPMVMDRTGEVSQTYRVSRNLPVTFLIDPDGVIREVFAGSLKPDNISTILGYAD